MHSLKTDILLETHNLDHYFEKGDLRLVKYIIKKCENLKDEYDWLYCAAKGGHKEIIELLISKGVNDLSDGFEGVCEGGHKELVELFKYNIDFNKGLYCACKGGHKEIVELLLAKGANDFNIGLVGACLGGYKEMVELMLSKGADNLNYGLYVTTDKDIVKLLISKGADFKQLNSIDDHELYTLYLKHGTFDKDHYSRIIRRKNYKIK